MDLVFRLRRYTFATVTGQLLLTTIRRQQQLRLVEHSVHFHPIPVQVVPRVRAAAEISTFEAVGIRQQ
jgi:hypothetical protein